MESTLQSIETERLILRAFTPEDWPGIQELAKDFAASDAAIYDHAWPTSEEGCKGAAGYFVNRKGLSWAVCLKADQRLIGYISYNGVDENQQLDLGHLFHSEFYCDDYDTEALGRLIDHAFTHQDIQSIHGDNAEDWAVQLASLKKLGFRLKPPPPGPVRKASFHKDEHGNPIEFVGCRMEIAKEDWLRRSRGETPVNVKTDGTKVCLAGVDPMDWGKGEMCEFAAALTRTLSCVGEEVPYHYVMGVTGVAFRFTFGPEHWNPGFYGFEGVSADVNDLIPRAFAAVGYGYIHHMQGDATEDRLRITDSLDRGISVMVRGHLVDASDWALVGGYDRDDSNLLFASSPYGRKDKPLPGLDAAPDWHAKTKYYLILGAKRERPAAETIYTDALRLAVTLVRSPKVGDHYAGLKALEVLADTLRNDEFPEDAERKEDKPWFRYLCILCYNMMLDDHKSAAPFLRDAANALPRCSAELTEAAACYERACEVRGQLETILKSDFSQEAQKSVLDPKVREGFAAALLKIRDIEEQGIAHIERALEK